jgi:hypothetical protein
MPRCFFHVQEGDVVHEDDHGQECESLEKMEREAAITAVSIARDLTTQGRYCHVCVKVTDETFRPVSQSGPIDLTMRDADPQLGVKARITAWRPESGDATANT